MQAGKEAEQAEEKTGLKRENVMQQNRTTTREGISGRIEQGQRNKKPKSKNEIPYELRHRQETAVQSEKNSKWPRRRKGKKGTAQSDHPFMRQEKKHNKTHEEKAIAMQTNEATRSIPNADSEPEQVDPFRYVPVKQETAWQAPPFKA